MNRRGPGPARGRARIVRSDQCRAGRSGSASANADRGGAVRRLTKMQLDVRVAFLCSGGGRADYEGITSRPSDRDCDLGRPDSTRPDGLAFAAGLCEMGRLRSGSKGGWKWRRQVAMGGHSSGSRKRRFTACVAQQARCPVRSELEDLGDHREAGDPVQLVAQVDADGRLVSVRCRSARPLLRGSVPRACFVHDDYRLRPTV